MSWGVYLPYWRLDRRLIGRAFGTGGGKGTRAVASYDEDTTSMAVEAGRRALAGPGAPQPASLYFSTPAPAYLDKTNATTVHAGLGSGPGRRCLRPVRLGALELGHLPAGRAGRGADPGPGGDRRSAHRPAGGARTRPKAATARWRLPLRRAGGVAELLGQAAATDEFLDRWRIPGETASLLWEDRFGEDVYVPLARSAFDRALDRAGSEGRARWITWSWGVYTAGQWGRSGGRSESRPNEWHPTTVP